MTRDHLRVRTTVQRTSVLTKFGEVTLQILADPFYLPILELDPSDGRLLYLNVQGLVWPEVRNICKKERLNIFQLENYPEIALL